jgi:hypothetical protein
MMVGSGTNPSAVMSPPSKVKCHSLAQIGRYLVEGLALRDDGDLLAHSDGA